MKYELINCVENNARQLASPAKNSVLDIPYKEEGKCLAASIEEDVGSFSLCPVYSRRQLRRIKQIKMRHSPREIRRKTTIAQMEGIQF